MFTLPEATDMAARDHQWRLRRQARDQQSTEQPATER